MTPQEIVKKFLENTKPRGDCLIWQGAIDDNGYGIARAGTQTVRVHRYIKLYEVVRSAEQVKVLNKYKLMRVEDCDYTHCLNSKHWIFDRRGEQPKLVPMVDWKLVYDANAIRGLS